jgi:hypothetical protein
MPQTKKDRRKRLLERISERNIDLDDHVIELFNQQASGVNNDGPAAQLDYMIAQGGLNWVEDVIFADALNC